MKNAITIGDTQIDDENKVFIIAEAGVNHNGSVDTAMEMIDKAKEAGADAIKFQTFKAEDVATSGTKNAEYAQRNLQKQESMVNMLKKLELTRDDFLKLKAYCDKKEIIFLSTPSTFDAINFLDELVPAFKIASSDITNNPFLKKIAEKRKPILLSTGMTTIDEISDALDVIRAHHNDKIILLHCTTQYPTELEDVNLRAMQTLKKEFNLLVGYSDHALGSDASKLAVELGAVVIEKHFTLDKSAKGPDHKASLEPDELKEMINAIRNQDFFLDCEKELLLGSAEKKPTPEEVEVAKVARKSIVAKKDIAKGEEFSEDNITTKRPGTGLSPKHYQNLIGKTSKRNIKADSLLTEEDIK